MVIFESLHDIKVAHPCSVSIGTFDGVHRGHMAVLDVMKDHARKYGLQTFVYTFKNNPASFFSGKTNLIMDEAEKISLFESLEVDYLAILPFDREQVDLSADSFVEDILVDKMRAGFISVGHDFRFGHGASSTAYDLRGMGQRLGFEVHIMEPVLHCGRRISSTDIREHLARGEMEEVAELLGRYYFIESTVTSGAAIGRKMGIPTINFSVNPELILRKGVYFTTCERRGEQILSITNVGFKPTVTNEHRLVVETHLLDFDGDLYGEKVKVHFLKWHRDERKFSSVSELSDQITKDITMAKTYFSKISHFPTVSRFSKEESSNDVFFTGKNCMKTIVSDNGYIFE